MSESQQQPQRLGGASTLTESCVVCGTGRGVEPRCPHCGAAARAGAFTISKLISQTAHGRVYLAHRDDGVPVALKELVFTRLPDLATLEAFRREAELLAALSHPAIPRLLSSFEEGDGVHKRLYLAEDFVEGVPLVSEPQTPAVGEDAAREIAERVLEILAYLQSRSPRVIHRDVKPANLLRRSDGTIALVDFGSARGTPGTLGATIDVGTWGYMPPEQLAGDVDATTDVYALAASLVELLSRRPPHDSRARDSLDISPHLRAWIDTALAASPEERFVDAEAALRALRHRSALPSRPAARARRRRAARTLGAATAGLIAGAALAFTVLSGFLNPADTSVHPRADTGRKTNIGLIQGGRGDPDGEPAP